jgi:hypothetical protein
MMLATGFASPKGDSGNPPGSSEEGAPVGIQLGMCAPDFSLPDGDGIPTRLSSFRGSGARVDISALW